VEKFDVHAAVVGGGVVAETVVDDPESVCLSGPYRVSARLHTVRRSLRGGVGMFALVVRFDCRDQAAVTRFDELTAAVVQQITEKEPGTLVYATHSVEGAPLARIFYEVYRDRDAFAAHEAADHVQQFHARKDPLLVGRRVEFLSPGTATGLVAA
jgi:quinol monooxygenase YgiN